MPEAVPQSPASSGAGPIALVYDDDAYVELTQQRRPPAAESAAGLIGRQVAGKEFLDAYLRHGSSTELIGLVRNPASAETLAKRYREHPAVRSRSRRLRIIEESRFHEDFLAQNVARLIHLPCPLDSRYAWARQGQRVPGFSLCGVTHTLSSASVMRQLCELITAPFEPFDALVCTSTAVVETVRAVTDTYAAYLKDRFGGEPRLKIRLEEIPLGVDTTRFRPATAAERAAERNRLGIGDDEIVVLFVGRLSHHAKAHPFPMLQGVGQAARETGRPVHLILAGWASHPAVHQAFVEGGKTFAEGARISIVDGTKEPMRSAVWRVADVFTSLSDNVQETFGLVVVEAMACGLPVVASDWNGYRDLVRNGETGYLIPTTMIEHATSETTSRLLMGEMDYDHFLAETSQAVAVDVNSARNAYRFLFNDPALRRKMGDAGRRVAVEQFDWQRIIRAYETLWNEQETERSSTVSKAIRKDSPSAGPALYPEPERSYRHYPTEWLGEDDFLDVGPDAQERLKLLLMMPLTNHVAWRRASDPQVLTALLKALPCRIAVLDHILKRAGVDYRKGRATIAWMFKYNLIRAVVGKVHTGI